ncbi:unnamed protein product [Ambrosiozyma monospora]|uniref:Unnamed protein product n=1 Tax=Ambrosiozyma monospora TaxID=43982 RepID=A0A9W6WE45_AMBMO|nr:unnamed protein product [Ambrosiozyma monospora]
MNQANNNNNKSFNSAISDSQDWGSIDDSEINEVLQMDLKLSQKQKHSESQLTQSYWPMDRSQDQLDGDKERQEGSDDDDNDYDDDDDDDEKKEEDEEEYGDDGVRVDVKSSQVDSMGTDDDGRVTFLGLGRRLIGRKRDNDVEMGVDDNEEDEVEEESLPVLLRQPSITDTFTISRLGVIE